jgi:hypothetical protein
LIVEREREREREREKERAGIVFSEDDARPLYFYVSSFPRETGNEQL